MRCAGCDGSWPGGATAAGNGSGDGRVANAAGGGA